MRDKQKKALKRLRTLLKKPRTMAQLVEKLGVSDRTLYRYFNDLGYQGVNVARAGRGYPVRFLIQ